jgi:AraC-like DNA-binding protein
MSDPIALRFTLEKCERELDQLEGTRRTVGRVQRILRREGSGVPSLVEVAATLHMSARTLKRQLATEGTSFSAEVEDSLRERALILLRSRTMPLKDIARTLGYSTFANFARAFQRWTGKTPGEMRGGKRDY